MKRWKKYLVSTMLTMLFACVFVGIKAEAEEPGQVSGLKQTGHTTSTAEIEWKKPSGDIIGYFVDVYPTKNSTTPIQTLEFDRVKATHVNITDLSPNKSYYVKVTAVDVYNLQGTPSNAFEVVTSPNGKPSSFKQTAATETQITMEWNGVSGVNAYQIWYKKTTDSKWDDNIVNVVNAKKKTIKVSKNTKYDALCFAARRSASGYMAVNYGTPSSNGTWSDAALLYDLTVKPTKIKNVKLINSGLDSNPSAGTVLFTWNKSNAADKYEYQITTYNGKTKIIKSGKVSLDQEITDNKWFARINSSKLKGKTTRFMRIKVRGYAKMAGNKKTVNGAWSDWCYFTKAVNVTAKWSGTSKINVSWKKVAGATNYTVYISPYGSNYGFKKVATTTKNSLSIKKYGKSSLIKSNTYYIKVVANKKVGGKNYTSDTTRSFKLYTTHY